jgi:hypothetical protein
VTAASLNVTLSHRPLRSSAQGAEERGGGNINFIRVVDAASFRCLGQTILSAYVTFVVLCDRGSTDDVHLTDGLYWTTLKPRAMNKFWPPLVAAISSLIGRSDECDQTNEYWTQHFEKQEEKIHQMEQGYQLLLFSS